MTSDGLPFGVHTIGSIYRHGVQASLPRYHPQQPERWGLAVAEPYTGNRLVAAWWVLTGRAHALRWPEPGDLEAAITPRSRPVPVPM